MAKVTILENPARRRKRRASAHRRRRRNPESRAERSRASRAGWAHRRRRRRNPESERERSLAARRGWRHGHRRHRRRNPAGEIGEVLAPAAFGAAGALALNVLLSYVTFLPASLQSGYGRVGVQIAAALGVGYIGPKMGLSRRTAYAAASGIAMIAIYDVVSSTLSSKFPALMGERFQVGMPGQVPPQAIPGQGFGKRFNLLRSPSVSPPTVIGGGR